jgi:general secretion pathway protein G
MRGIKITVGIVFTAIVLLLTARTLHEPIWNLRFHSAKALRVEADLEALRSVLAFYKLVNGVYPSTEQGLAAVVVPPGSSFDPQRSGPRLAGMPKDPWGRDYFYRCPGRTNPTGYDLFSAGPDGRPYTADDDWGR